MAFHTALLYKATHFWPKFTASFSLVHCEQVFLLPLFVSYRSNNYFRLNVAMFLYNADLEH